jgi:hypothetical protein
MNEGKTIQLGTERPRWFAWAPNIDTLMALLTEAWMIGAYYTVNHWIRSDVGAALQFGLLTNLLVNVLLPLWWITIYRKQPLSELGITTRRWLPALFIGIALAVFGSFRLRELAAGTDWLPHVVYNAVILWEPFFIFAWLQLRFDRAFGILPGVLLTGLSFAAYHIGTFPPASLVVLLISGLVYAAIFRLTRNLLSMWPLAWCVASSLGTLMGPYHFTWQQVAIWSVILVIQLSFIGYVWWKQRK